LNSIRSYRNFASILLRKAKALGWVPQRPEIPNAWKPILGDARGAKTWGCAGIVHYAISQNKTPGEFSDEDLDRWGEMMLRRRRTFGWVQICKRRFRRGFFKVDLLIHCDCTRRVR